MARFSILCILCCLTLSPIWPARLVRSDGSGTTVSGQVQDVASLFFQGTGGSVADAKISVLQDPSIETRSGKDGSFSLKGVPVGRPINLVVEGPGFIRTLTPNLSAGSNDIGGYTAYAGQSYLVDVAGAVLTTMTGIVGNPTVGVTLDRSSGLVAGMVIDEKTGKRLAGASVELVGRGAIKSAIQRLAETDKVTFTSPSIGYPFVEGVFFIPNVPPGAGLTLRPKETGSPFTKARYVFDPVDVVSVAGGATFVIIKARSAPQADKAPQPAVSISFTDVSDKIGVHFRHQSLLPFFNLYQYALGPGISVNDYDNDGNLDFYVSNGLGFPGALYRNNGNGTFTDATARAGVANLREGNGVGFGDIDNDGDLDLYVTSSMGNRLYRNNGDGTFTDITRQAGVGDGRNARSVSFVDYDNDGYLDIFVSNYDFEYNVDFGRNDNPGQGNVLYRNNRDGTFTDVTARAGIGYTGLAFAQVFTDYDNDGDLDLFIVHDVGKIVLYRNNGDGTFTDVSVQAGFSEIGSWMGITSGDYDNDGYFDIFVTNVGPPASMYTPQLPGKLTNLMHALYHNNGNGTFTEVARKAGVADAGWGWGCEFGDFDNDGHLDLYLVTNFFVMGVGGMGDFSVYGPLPPGGIGGTNSFFFLSNGDGTFREATSAVGINNPWDARGVALADYDGDGFLDIFVTNERGPLVIYKNSGNRNHWLKVKAVGTISNRDAVGAKVKIVAGGKQQIREVSGGSSFKSQQSLEVEFGLGSQTTVDSVQVIFPSGRVVTRQLVSADQLIKIEE